MASPATVGEPFTAFYHRWLLHQEPIFHRLQSAASSGHDEQCRALVAQVVAHFQEYFAEKARAAKDDVFQFFSSPWLTSLEQAFLWLAGFKPSALFSLVDGGMLSEEQSCKLGMLRAETAKVERAISEAMASVQETAAAAPVAELMKREAANVDGEAPETCAAAMEELKRSIGKVMGSADALRASTAFGILEVLGPKRGVKFLTAVMKSQREVRRWGLYMDSHHQR